MAEKIDKSLDDIIKERKISGRTPRGGARREGGGRGGPRGGGMRRGAPANALANRSFGQRRQNGGMVQKRRSAGTSPLKGVNASINGQWNHDLFQARRSGGGQAGVRPESAKLVISNLDFGVNDQDIKGLFQEFGTIKKAAVHYDRSGRSLGTADVVFERKSDAVKALKKYNQVSLDGRPMDIKLTTGLEQAVAQVVARTSGGSPGQRGGRGGARGGRGGRGGATQKPREPKVVKTAADLDADLDSYNSKMQTD